VAFSRFDLGSGAAAQKRALDQIARLIATGCSEPAIVRAARAITRDCDPRDDQCELEAIYDAVKHGTDRVPGLENGLRYVADPRTSDYYVGAIRTIQECRAGACAGDCLPYDTLVLRNDYRLVPLSEIKIGDMIMGDGAWTTVTNRWDKGEKDILDLTLANGSTISVTAEHRLFRVPKIGAGYAGSRETAEEVQAGDVHPGDDLLTADRLPFGAGSLESDLAWLIGVYVADGWSEDSTGDGLPLRAFISGKDGHPKEEQKRRVVEIANRMGWETRWHERYVAINDRATANWLATTGKRAPQKHVPSGLNYDEPTIRALLSGLMADAHVGNGHNVSTVHGTTSELLALQLRVIYRMLGQSTHIRRVDKHGGLGKNPVYRVTPRAPDRGRGAKPHARVRSISDGGCAPVMDIETDSGRFYLPESDLIVHNCDEHTILVAALCGAIGFKVGARAYGPDPKKQVFEHVYAVVAMPKRGPWKPSDIVGMDTTVPDASVGWQPPKGAVLTFWIEEG
jgi:hypothetical protein